ncbi:MAG: GNAT family N-acetyltransferase [Candidatus Coatesbacteria bacterium]|nr:GNAT family N-acetyltransferase [Candidatus Coatesbacteria bacterium]
MNIGFSFISKEWLQCLEKSFDNLKLDIIQIWREGELVGAMPCFIYGKKIIQPPSIPYMGPLIAPAASNKYSRIESNLHKFCNVLIRELLKSKYEYICFNAFPDLIDIRSFIWKNWNINVRYTYLVDFRNIDLKELWNIVDHNSRTQVRKAEKEGVVIKIEEELPEIYDIYRKQFSPKRPSRLILKKKQIEEIYYTMKKENCLKCYCAYTKNNELISFYIAAIDNKRAYLWLGGINNKFKNTQATSLMYWEIIKDLFGKVDHLDLVGANIYDIALFKRDFATHIIPFYQVELYSKSANEIAHVLKKHIARRKSE